MITMLGNHKCIDCVKACAEIERQHLPIEFHDMETSMAYLKEFLKVRDENPELFDVCRQNNSIGIPVFVLEDGTVTFDRDVAFEAARNVKAPAIPLVGTWLCPDCRAVVERAKAEGMEFEFHDVLENLQDMRLYLKFVKVIRRCLIPFVRIIRLEFRCLCCRMERFLWTWKLGWQH